MTPDRPLRRSNLRQGGVSMAVAVNDDNEERREQRRRTVLAEATNNDSSTVEHSERLKKCLDICNTNKLSRENAWSVSLIDTLSTLLDRHHKSLNNFKVAGSSLEASSKVYGLRVDCIHTDVLRMSAGLNAQKYNERNGDDDDDGVATGGDGAADPGSPAAGLNEAAAKTLAKKAKQKRARKVVSTITKNKETLNARLDTVPLQDPIFGKLNSIVGSINASNRLMLNVLLTSDSELRLRTNFRFWDSNEVEQCDYTEEQMAPVRAELVSCERLFKIARFEELELRPLHGAYLISDTPEALPEEKEAPRRLSVSLMHDDEGRNWDGDVAEPLGEPHREHSMAFDINAECEPLSSEMPPLVDVDYDDFDDLTVDERNAINNCRGLRRVPVPIEDLRPVDASSRLEYSYRPLDKISQFWAGPSHWKFKRSRARPSTLTQEAENVANRGTNARARRANLMAKKRFKQLNFSEVHDELFLKLNSEYKPRKTNLQKKWDPRKLKLPTDLQVDQNMFFKYNFAPGFTTETYDQNTMTPSNLLGDVDEDICSPVDANHPYDAEDCGDMNMMDASADHLAAGNNNALDNSHFAYDDHDAGADAAVDSTVLEISTEFQDAPSQVTKIMVPFAKRAKVIDMKNMKTCCAQLLNKQLKQPIASGSALKGVDIRQEERYGSGLASFKELYLQLPTMLNDRMSEALSPAIAFYSVLHLANDFNLRLLKQEHLKDFNILQMLDDTGGVTPMVI